MVSLKDLKHIKKKGESGFEVFLLDKGEIIDSEAEAMLQALHSRSTGGFLNHMKILEEKGASNFMSKFYVGYGHKSIGDCSSSTIFVERISMLAAKALQDSKLYNGQESSTRYVDFSKQKMLNPLNSKEGEEILERQRKFYLKIVDLLKKDLEKRYPKKENEDEKIWKKAISAKAFDIARGFLPAGTTTNIAWHSTLRHFADRLLFLRHHPLDEIRKISLLIEEVLQEKYPNSFNHKRYEKTEEYQDLIAKYYYYHNKNQEEFKLEFNNINKKLLEEYKELFDKRPEKTELPSFISQLGEIGFSFKLDFGSFRDIQRHRAVNQRMPLLTTDLGFNEWYINNLPEDIKKETKEYLDSLIKDINNLTDDIYLRQYYIPFGFNISNYVTGTLNAFIYLIELRSTIFVHPTLRKKAHQMAKTIEDELNIKLYIDKKDLDFNINRGKQDIELKK
jgi:thymidylate synthase ThyX